METTLNFLETQTTEQFKNHMMVTKIDIKQNPKNGNIFFTYGSKTGMVAKKVADKLTGKDSKPMGVIMFSHVTGISQIDGSPIDCWMLHEEGHGNAPVLASF